MNMALIPYDSKNKQTILKSFYLFVYLYIWVNIAFDELQQQ